MLANKNYVGLSLSNDLDDLHLSILTKYYFPRRRLLFSNLKVGDCSPMYTNMFHGFLSV